MNRLGGESPGWGSKQVRPYRIGGARKVRPPDRENYRILLPLAPKCQADKAGGQEKNRTRLRHSS